MSANEANKTSSKREKLKPLRINTLRYKSEPRQIRPCSNDFSGLVSSNPFDSQRIKFGNYQFTETLKKAIGDLIDYNVMQEKSGLQNKIDYYITPYNKTQNFKPSMEFEDKSKHCRNLSEKAQKDWKILSNFILNSEKQDFRRNLSMVNKNLYKELKDLAVTFLKTKPTNSESVKHGEVHHLKKLKRQTTIQKRHDFQKKIKESYETYERVSRKNLPNYSGDSLSKYSDTPDSEFKSKKRSISSGFQNLSFRNITEEGDKEVVSVISPLIKIMRDKKKNKEIKDMKRQQKIVNQNEFELKLMELAGPLLRPIKKNSSTSLLKTYNSVHQTPLPLSGKLLEVTEKPSIT